MKLDQELKKLAEDWSEKVFTDLALALHDPAIGLKGDALTIYNELKAWGWLQDLPIDDDEENKFSIDPHLFYQKMFAMNKYRQLKWAKDHPPKPKLSKWEIVTGTRLKKTGQPPTPKPPQGKK